jgi:hypothetical protein
MLEQVTVLAQFAHFYPHRGAAAAPEEEVTGRPGGKNRKSGQEILEVIAKDPTDDPKKQRESICNGKQDINAARSRRYRTQYQTKTIRTTVTSPVNWP